MKKTFEKDALEKKKKKIYRNKSAIGKATDVKEVYILKPVGKRD